MFVCGYRTKVTADKSSADKKHENAPRVEAPLILVVCLGKITKRKLENNNLLLYGKV